MKNLTEDILSSFRQRIKENEDLVTDVQKTLDGFRKDHQEMAAILNANAAALRKGLLRGEKERMSTFNGLMNGIHRTITSIQKEVLSIQTSTFKMIDDFNSDRALMADELNKSFARGRADRMQNEKKRMKEFDNLMENINDDIKSINDEVLTILKNTNDMLDRFNNEHLEMSTELRAELSKNLADRVEYTRTMLSGFQKRLSEISKENQRMAQKLRKDLANGEAARMGEYNDLMKEIHLALKGISKEVNEIKKSTAGMLGDLLNNREQASAMWGNMQTAMTQIRKTGFVSTPKEAVKKAEKKVEKMDIPFEIAKGIQVKAQPKKEPKQEIPMTLEEKIIDYINKHPNGVKISEMEEPLGVIRMKLGFAAKNLLNEGKVQKVENVYFPLNIK
ncbi:MAG: hypothetical protein WCS03_09110 [Bacteroidota bacterium]